jgi:hypothetical protein
MTATEHSDLEELRKKVEGHCRTNDILNAAATFPGRSSTRRPKKQLPSQ